MWMKDEQSEEFRTRRTDGLSGYIYFKNENGHNRAEKVPRE